MSASLRPTLDAGTAQATVVIRAACERTLPACRWLLESQCRASQVLVVREVPFCRAVQRTFELGLEAGRRWTIAVDADVLVRRGGLAELIAAAEQTRENVFKVEGYILDKLFGGPRAAGMHLYRTALLEPALRHVPAEQAVHRPEYHVVLQMQAAGYGFVVRDFVLAAHDFEQDYRDLYRKGFVHAQKHGEFLRFFEPMWRRLAKTDADFRAVLLGMDAGRAAGGIARTDLRAFSDHEYRVLEAAGLSEKPPLAADHFHPAALASWIANYRAEPEFHRWQRWQQRQAAGPPLVRRAWHAAVASVPRPIKAAVKRALGVAS